MSIEMSKEKDSKKLKFRYADGAMLRHLSEAAENKFIGLIEDMAGQMFLTHSQVMGICDRIKNALIQEDNVLMERRAAVRAAAETATNEPKKAEPEKKDVAFIGQTNTASVMFKCANCDKIKPEYPGMTRNSPVIGNTCQDCDDLRKNAGQLAHPRTSEERAHNDNLKEMQEFVKSCCVPNFTMMAKKRNIPDLMHAALARGKSLTVESNNSTPAGLVKITVGGP